MKRLGMLAFLLASSWTMLSWADAAPPSDDCTLSKQTAKASGPCHQCSDQVDGGLAGCQEYQRAKGLGYVCSGTYNGTPVEIWCPPAAGSTAPPKGCSLSGAAGPSPLGVFAALSGLGLALVLGRRWRRT